LQVLMLIIFLFSSPRLVVAGELEAYAALSEGFQKTYQIIQQEDEVEVDKRILRTLVLSKIKIGNRDVIPVKITNEGLTYKDKIRWTFIDYLLLSPDRLLIVATKYSQEIEMHQRDDLLLKAPLAKGATWVTGVYEKIVETRNDTIQVPAGVFTNCLKIKTIRKIDGQMVYEKTAWYASEVGEIKNIVKYPQEHTQFNILLMNVKKQNRKKRGQRRQ
jgi:hypothetical protein